MAGAGGASVETTADVPADSQFAPTTKSTDGSTAIAVSDSEFTTPTNVSASSVDGTESGSSTETVDNTGALTETLYVNQPYHGERITDATLRSAVITRATFSLQKVGSPTGTAVARVRKTSDDSIVATSTTSLDVSTISTSQTDYNFDFTGAITPNEEFYILVEYSGGDGSNYVRVFRVGANSYSKGYRVQYGPSSWYTYASEEMRMSFVIASANGLKDNKSSPTTIKWQSNSEVAPWCKADMGSAVEMLGVAIHFHANTNITSFKIETSADDSTYIRRKTVPYTLITEGAWNIILFPRPPLACRYLKITALDAGAKVISVNEIAVFVLTESVINRRHRIVEYSPTSSCLTLTGA